MKSKASVLLKQVMAALSSIMKAKSKTSAAKARLVMFSFMKNKKVVMNSISDKIHSVLGHDHLHEDEVVENEKAMVLYRNEVAAPEYEEVGEAGGSVTDIVRSSKEEEGRDFKLEDEIDHVADLFIRRFHKQIRLQKLESFKLYQEMLLRGSA